MIVAGFTGPEALLRAAGALREAGIAVETRTPIALPGDEEGRSRLPMLVLAAGLLAAAAGFGMQSYAAMVSYPMLIGGRPGFFWTSYLVYALECGALAATVTAFGGFLLANRLPRYWEPADESEALREATRDGWFLLADGAEARRILRGHAPSSLEELAG